MASERERWATQLRERRTAMNLTQIDLALILSDRSGREITQRDLSAFERLVRPVPEDLKPELIRVLSIDPEKVAPDWVRPLLRRAAA